VLYLDKQVGKLVAALETLGLRERTLIVFAGDNGTSRNANPRKVTGSIGGRQINGQKGELLEGGSRVPLVASWKGTTPAGRIVEDLIDFSDLLPTFAELAGATLPKEYHFDGHSFLPQLRGEAGEPREWVFVQLGNEWYVRNRAWKLNSAGELFSMRDAPFVEQPTPESKAGSDASAARQALQAVLNELNPSAGKTEVAVATKKVKPKNPKKSKDAKQHPTADD
jgi:arylsulfatase A